MEAYYNTIFNQILNTLFVPWNEDHLLEEKEISQIIVGKLGMNNGNGNKCISNNLPLALFQHRPFISALKQFKGDYIGLKYIGGDKQYEIKIVEKGKIEQEMKDTIDLRDKLINQYNTDIHLSKKQFLQEYNKMKKDLEERSRNQLAVQLQIQHYQLQKVKENFTKKIQDLVFTHEEEKKKIMEYFLSEKEKDAQRCLLMEKEVQDYKSLVEQLERNQSSQLDRDFEFDGCYSDGSPDQEDPFVFPQTEQEDSSVALQPNSSVAPQPIQENSSVSPQRQENSSVAPQRQEKTGKSVSFQQDLDVPPVDPPPPITNSKLKIVKNGKGIVLENWVLFSFSLFLTNHTTKVSPDTFFDNLTRITCVDKSSLFCVLSQFEASFIEFLPFGKNNRTKLSSLKKDKYFFFPSQLLPIIALIFCFIKKNKEPSSFFSEKTGNYLFKSLLYTRLSSFETIFIGESLFDNLVKICENECSNRQRVEKDLKGSCFASNQYKNSDNHLFISVFLDKLSQQIPGVNDQKNFLNCFRRRFPNASSIFVETISEPEPKTKNSQLQISFLQRFSHWVNSNNIQKTALIEGLRLLPECSFPPTEIVFSTITKMYQIVRSSSGLKYQKEDNKVVGLQVDPSIAIKNGIFLSLVDGEVSKLKNVYWKWMYDGFDFFGRSLSLFSGQLVGFRKFSLSYKNLVNLFLNFEDEVEGAKWMEIILREFNEIKEIELPNGDRVPMDQVYTSDYKVISKNASLTDQEEIGNTNSKKQKTCNKSFCVWCGNAFNKCLSKNCKTNGSDCVCKKVKSYIGSGSHLVMKFEKTKGRIIAFPHQIIIECVHCGLRTLERVITVTICKTSKIYCTEIKEFVERVNKWMRETLFNGNQSLKIVYNPPPTKKGMVTPSCFKIVKGSEESRMKFVANVSKFVDYFMNENIITNERNLRDTLVDMTALQIAFLKEGYKNHKRRLCYEIEEIQSNQKFKNSFLKLLEDVLKPLKELIGATNINKKSLYASYKCCLDFWASNLLVVTNIYRHGIPGNQESTGSNENDRIKQFLVNETNKRWSKWECESLDEGDKYDFVDYLIMILLVCIRFVNGGKLPGWYEHFLTHIVPLLRKYLRLLIFSSSNLEGQIKANKYNNNNTNNISNFQKDLDAPDENSPISSMERVFLKPLTEKLFSLYFDLSLLPDTINTRNENQKFKINGTTQQLKDISPEHFENLQNFHKYLEDMFGTEGNIIKEKIVPIKTYNTKKRKQINQDVLENIQEHLDSSNHPISQSQDPPKEHFYNKRKIQFNSTPTDISTIGISIIKNGEENGESEEDEDNIVLSSDEEPDDYVDDGEESNEESDKDLVDEQTEIPNQEHNENLSNKIYPDWISDILLRECKNLVKVSLEKKDLTILERYIQE